MLQLLDITAANGSLIGDSAPVGATKVNQNFKEVYQLMTQRAGAATKAGVIQDGDSKGDEPRQALILLAAKYNLDIDFSTPGLNVGGSTLSSILASPRIDNLKSAIATAISKVPILDYMLSITTNDGNSDFTYVYTNLSQIYVILKSLGIRYFWLRATPPSVSTYQDPRARRAKIAAMIAFARDHPLDVLFFDETNWMIDMTNANGDPIGGGNNAFGAVTRDGVHMNNRGVSRLSNIPSFYEIARAIYRAKPLPGFGQNDAFENTAAGRGANLIGTKGRFLALGGGTSLTGATVNGSAPLGWNLSGHAEGLTVTFSTIAEVPLLASQHNMPGIPGVRMAITGTNTSSAGSQPSVALEGGFMNPSSSEAFTAAGGLVCALNDVVGINGIGLEGPYNSGGIGVTSFTKDGLNDALDTMRGVYTVPIYENAMGAGGPYNFAPKIYFYFPVGATINATIDLILFDWRKVNTNPKSSS